MAVKVQHLRPFEKKRSGFGSGSVSWVDSALIGIEPVTSSMPWNETDIKLLTAKDLLVG
jgi:hypothetical protein